MVAQQFGAWMALLANSLSFLLSAASLWPLRFGRPTPGTTKGAQTLAGYRFLVEEPLLGRLAALLVALGLMSSVGVGAGVIDVFVFRLKNELGATQQMVGVVLGLGAVGAVAAALVTPALRRHTGFTACFVGGTLVQAAGLCAGGAIHAATATAIASFLWSAGLVIRSIPLIALRQAITPAPLLGRVTAAFWTLTFGSSALGTVLVTRAAADWGSGRLLVALGTGVGLVGLVSIPGAAQRTRQPAPAGTIGDGS
jgi:hypothetical protein